MRTLIVVCGLLAVGTLCTTVEAQTKPVVTDQQERSAPVEFKAIPEARAKANEILQRGEFRHVEQNSFLAQKLGRLSYFVNLLFSHAAGMIPQSPWFATALEWGVLAVAAAGLLLWVLRVNKQQRIAITTGGGRTNELWQKDSDDWAERARTEAGKGEWREAVHCLYWSAIVLLEGQKMWRQNRARTPREYVVLLEPDSAKQKALRGLTGVFERIWYGLRPAAESDYRRATAMLEQLRPR